MTTSPMTFGDISPRTAAYVMKRMLDRAVPHLMLEMFGEPYTVPLRNSKTAKWRRYNSLPLATTPLVEGVTPAGRKVTVTDVEAALAQYGDFVPFTDVVMDTHEDPVLQQLSDVLTEQMAQTVETIRYNVIKGGTSVQYANGSARTDVNTPISLDLQRAGTRALKRQNADMVNSIVGPSANFNTVPVEAGFIGLVHTDVENDIRALPGFTSVSEYPGGKAYQNEIGAVEDVRYIRSTLFTPWTDAGGAKGSMISTTGTLADVYPVIYLAKRAYGTVTLKGKDAAMIKVVLPKPAAGDPLGQRGTAGWITWQTAVILNDLYMVRGEVGATA